MTDAEREAIHAAIDALPPMTEEQIEAIAEVIIVARERRRHTCQTSRGPPLLSSDDDARPLASRCEMQLMMDALECAQCHIHDNPTLHPPASRPSYLEYEIAFEV